MNALTVIAPYKALGMWVFDDVRAGLVQEPFVGGADTLIDRMVAHILDADEGFRLVFSAEPFPGGLHRFDWVRAEMSGNVYRSEEYDSEGWLCPALFKYFESPPPQLYVNAETLKR